MKFLYNNYINNDKIFHKEIFVYKKDISLEKIYNKNGTLFTIFIYVKSRYKGLSLFYYNNESNLKEIHKKLYLYIGDFSI